MERPAHRAGPGDDPDRAPAATRYLTQVDPEGTADVVVDLHHPGWPVIRRMSPALAGRLGPEVFLADPGLLRPAGGDLGGALPRRRPGVDLSPEMLATARGHGRHACALLQRVDTGSWGDATTPEELNAAAEALRPTLQVPTPSAFLAYTPGPYLRPFNLPPFVPNVADPLRLDTAAQEVLRRAGVEPGMRVLDGRPGRRQRRLSATMAASRATASSTWPSARLP